MAKHEPCDLCDFVGPEPYAEQHKRSSHRAFHNFARAWNAAFGPLATALGNMALAGQVPPNLAGRQDAASALAPKLRENGYGPVYAPHEDPRLLPDDEEDDMTTYDPTRVKAGDTITLARDKATHTDEVGWVGTQHPGNLTVEMCLAGDPDHMRTVAAAIAGFDRWIITDHTPHMPANLIVGQLYLVDTTDQDGVAAYWEPIDGIRANHPWVVAGEPETRYRSDYVIRAHAVPPVAAGGAE